MLSWSNNAYRFTIGIGSLGIVAMIGDLTDSLLPAWLAIGIALFPFCLFVFARPEELPVSIVRVAHILASVVYLATTFGLFYVLFTTGPLKQGWQVYVVTSIVGAIPCVAVLMKVMLGTYEPAASESQQSA